MKIKQFTSKAVRLLVQITFPGDGLHEDKMFSLPFPCENFATKLYSELNSRVWNTIESSSLNFTPSPIAVPFSRECFETFIFPETENLLQ